MISNHIEFFEVVVLMLRYSAGFMAKKDVVNYYFVGPIATAMHCLFIERKKPDERKKIFMQLEERTNNFMKENFWPFGHVSRRYNLKWKKYF